VFSLLGGDTAGQLTEADRDEISVKLARVLSAQDRLGQAFWPGILPDSRGRMSGMSGEPLIQKLDAVSIPVPDLDQGLRFYRDALGHELKWRNDDIGQAGLGMPDTDTEIVLTTAGPDYAPNWLVPSADEAARRVLASGGRMVTEPFDIPVGRVAVVADPFGNPLILVDLSKGLYRTGDDGRVTGTGADAGE
jgi:predicted enzyme related to lactoylglutathione lyase